MPENNNNDITGPTGPTVPTVPTGITEIESAHRILESFLSGKHHETLTDDHIQAYVAKAFAVAEAFADFKP